MSELAWFDDSQWCLLEFSGADRKDFLHRLTTNDLPRPGDGFVHNFFLSVNARIQAEFWVLAEAERLLLFTPVAHKEALKECIDRYHFGEKIKLEELEGNLIVLEGDFDSEIIQDFGFDPRYGSPYRWALKPNGPPENPASLSEATLEVARVKLGRVKLGLDYDENTLFVEIAQNEDFSESKGCYPGQEIVARVLHRGRLNRHLRAFKSDQVIPNTWSLKVDGKEVATVKSSVATDEGSIGFILVRREYGDDNTELTGQDSTGESHTLTVVPREGEVRTGEES